MSAANPLEPALKDALQSLEKIFAHPCSNASGTAPTNIATIAFLAGGRVRNALKAHAASVERADPAAVFGVADSLHRFAERPGFKGNVSEAYDGADQFMREVMSAGERFETWACENVDFSALTDVWPYMLQDKFADALEAIYPGAILELPKLSATTWVMLATKLELKLNTREGNK